MNTFNIGNYLNPHLSLIYTDYYDKQIELYIIDMIYHFLNNDNIKHNKKLLNKNIRFKLTVDELPKINDIIKLNNDKLSKINELIDNYKNELERVNEIYNLFKKFDFNFINKYKDVYLSGLIAERNNITSFCNIKEFIKPYKSFIEKKFKNKFNWKKINEKDYAIIFILDIINKIFNDYINAINYGINLLTNKSFIIRYNNEEYKYLPVICYDNFIIINNKINIKHLNMINNIQIIGKSNNSYIVIYKTPTRIDIYFD